MNTLSSPDVLIDTIEDDSSSLPETSEIDDSSTQIAKSVRLWSRVKTHIIVSLILLTSISFTLYTIMFLISNRRTNGFLKVQTSSFASFSIKSTLWAFNIFKSMVEQIVSYNSLKSDEMLQTIFPSLLTYPYGSLIEIGRTGVLGSDTAFAALINEENVTICRKSDNNYFYFTGNLAHMIANDIDFVQNHPRGDAVGNSLAPGCFPKQNSPLIYTFCSNSSSANNELCGTITLPVAVLEAASTNEPFFSFLTRSNGKVLLNEYKVPEVPTSCTSLNYPVNKQIEDFCALTSLFTGASWKVDLSSSAIAMLDTIQVDETFVGSESYYFLYNTPISQSISNNSWSIFLWGWCLNIVLFIAFVAPLCFAVIGLTRLGDSFSKMTHLQPSVRLPKLWFNQDTNYEALFTQKNDRIIENMDAESIISAAHQKMVAEPIQQEIKDVSRENKIEAEKLLKNPEFPESFLTSKKFHFDEEMESGSDFSTDQESMHNNARRMSSQVGAACSASTTILAKMKYESGAPKLEPSSLLELTETRIINSSIDRLNLGLESFVKYVPNSVVKELLMNSSEAKLGLRSHHVALMVLDIADFTTLSESLDAVMIKKMLSRAFSSFCDAIQSFRGYVDKFAGDAIVAFWNAPDEIDHYATRATLAALECHARLSKINDDLVLMGMPRIAIRVGVATGDVMAGNVGHSARFDYTIVGNAVSLVHGLESFNKLVATRILVDSQTYQLSKDVISYRFIGKVSIANQQTKIYEPLGVMNEVPDELVKKNISYARVMYNLDHHLTDEAIESYNDHLMKYPNDLACIEVLGRRLSL